MYLDTSTMIGIMIALITSILTMGYCMYIIKKQNEIIQMHQIASATRRRMERQIAMRSREELLKIKEAFAYAMMDMLDVYDELIGNTPRKLWVTPEPTVNDLVKNEEESNAQYE